MRLVRVPSGGISQQAYDGHVRGPESRWSTGGQGPAALLLLGAVLCGLLGMHALGSHGTSHASGQGAGHVSSHDTGHDTGHHAGHHAGHGAGSAAAIASYALPSSGDEAETAVSVLCLALLVGAAVALVLRTGWRLPRPRAQRLSSQVSRPVRVWRRGAGPPYVWEFSVLRC